MKKLFFIAGLFIFLFALSATASTSLDGRIIALDAGHGADGATGAIGECGDVSVAEVDVNRAVRDALTEKLSADNADVFLVPQLSSRKDRVAAAEEYGAEVLISIHHNGSSDPEVNYTKSFITQGSDKKLANPVHDALVAALGLPDRGIKHDGFGITVYGDIPGVLTESYFITNTEAACDFLTEEQSLVETEAQAMHEGLSAYFSSTGGGGDDGGNGGGNSCPPGKEKQGKC